MPEIAQHSDGKPVSKVRGRELVPPSFDEIVRRADLIVDGLVTPQITYLSDDQVDLYTDYVVTLGRVFAARRPVQVSPGAPGIVLRQFGGRTTINGVEVSEVDQNMPPLAAGRHVILLLIYNEALRKYELPSEIAGAFEVYGGKITPLLRSSRTYEPYKGMSLADFEAEIHRLGR